MSNRAAPIFLLIAAGVLGLYWTRKKIVEKPYEATSFPASPFPKIVGTPLPPEKPIVPAVQKPMKKIGARKMKFTTPVRGMVYEDSFIAASNKHNIPPGLLSRMAMQESNYNPRAVSPAGAVGLMQFMPGTAKDLNLDPLNPWDSIDKAGQYMRWLYNRVGSWKMALAAYNWGIGNVQRKGFAKAPQETQIYVARISEDTGVT